MQQVEDAYFNPALTPRKTSADVEEEQRQQPSPKLKSKKSFPTAMAKLSGLNPFAKNNEKPDPETPPRVIGAHLPMRDLSMEYRKPYDEPIYVKPPKPRQRRDTDQSNKSKKSQKANRSKTPNSEAVENSHGFFEKLFRKKSRLNLKRKEDAIPDEPPHLPSLPKDISDGLGLPNTPRGSVYVPDDWFLKGRHEPEHLPVEQSVLDREVHGYITDATGRQVNPQRSSGLWNTYFSCGQRYDSLGDESLMYHPSNVFRRELGLNMVWREESEAESKKSSDGGAVEEEEEDVRGSLSGVEANAGEAKAVRPEPMIEEEEFPAPTRNFSYPNRSNSVRRPARSPITAVPAPNLRQTLQQRRHRGEARTPTRRVGGTFSNLKDMFNGSPPSRPRPIISYPTPVSNSTFPSAHQPSGGWQGISQPVAAAEASTDSTEPSFRTYREKKPEKLHVETKGHLMRKVSLDALYSAGQSARSAFRGTFSRVNEEELKRQREIENDPTSSFFFTD